jgi:hypothetical protein
MNFSISTVFIFSTSIVLIIYSWTLIKLYRVKINLQWVFYLCNSIHWNELPYNYKLHILSSTKFHFVYNMHHIIPILLCNMIFVSLIDNRLNIKGTPFQGTNILCNPTDIWYTYYIIRKKYRDMIYTKSYPHSFNIENNAQ